MRRDNYVIFPLLHPAAALHQGNLREPLGEDFRKLKRYLDQLNAPPPEATPVSVEPPLIAQVQMDLF
jgi:DNA polymerase